MFCETVIAGMALVYWWINPNLSATALSISAVASGQRSSDPNFSLYDDTQTTAPLADSQVVSDSIKLSKTTGSKPDYRRPLFR